MPKLYINKENIVQISNLEVGVLAAEKFISFDVPREQYTIAEGVTVDALFERRRQYQLDRAAEGPMVPSGPRPGTWTGAARNYGTKRR